MSTSEVVDVDAVVLGMGPGGEDIAGNLASAGLSVIGIDGRLVGGECPYWGCIPSKMIVRAGQLLAEARRVDGTAGSATVVPDWTPVAARLREATDGWDDRVAVERFTGKGGTFVRGRGRMVDRNVVEVDGQRFRASRAVVVATGAAPSVPPVDGLVDTPFWTNRDVVEATTLPRSLVVLGGGAIGAELAQALARFGVLVTVVEAAGRLLPPEEPATSALITDVFRREGITVITGVGAAAVSYDGDGFHVQLADGRVLSAERLLVATGRRVELDEIGAGVLGVDPSTARALPVDDRLRVADGVWAVGDVTGKGAFTHVAMYQSAIATADILGRVHHAADYTGLPRVTFTDPEIGSVGSTEAAAREHGLDVAVGRVDLADTTRGWLHGPGGDGFIQVVADRSRGVLVGATTIGPSGGEVLGLLAMAVHLRTPIAELRTAIYAYPTFHRGIEQVLRDLG